jgi:hypothetical protein
VIHDPVVKGKGSSCYADCDACGPKAKVCEGHGAVVGSRAKVNRAAERHRQETLKSCKEDV